MIRRGAIGLLLAVMAMLGQAHAAAPRDVAYRGTIQLRVDLTDVERRIFRVEETLPVAPGDLTLLYPLWLPGKHAPRGHVEMLAGLDIRAGDQVLDWQRDPLNLSAFRVRVPPGVSSLRIAFDIALPQLPDVDRVVPTAKMLALQWNQVVLYPQGWYVRRIPVAAEVRLPSGWVPATSLRTRAAATVEDGWVRFAAVPLEELIDSPLYAGAHGGAFDLAPGAPAPVRLNVFAESHGDLAMTPAQLAAYRALVREAAAALGPPRYDRYEFLLALSDSFGSIGLEHFRSSENSLSPAHFSAWDEDIGSRDLLAHEFTHSWNGKARRPARLWTSTYNEPMQDDLLWVYEGMTQFYGGVLTTRAGLWDAEFHRAMLAAVAAVYDRKRPGSAWRPLVDTTHQPIITPRAPLSWTSWQRTEDYYSGGMLVWLEVDMRLRELSGGARGLDDFARGFLAAPANEGTISTYEFGDVISALQAVAPFDWRKLLRERLEGTSQPVIEGLTRAGWRLVYDDKPNAYIRDAEKARRSTDLSYSLGITLNRDAMLTEVVWESPAFKAGLTTNTTVVAVQGRSYTADLLKDAINQAQRDGQVIELLVKNQDRYRTVRIDYREGLRYPRLERIADVPDRLADLLRARTAAPVAP